MGRKPRLHIDGGLYHIIARGNNQKEIFLDNSDYSAFLEKLQELKETLSFKLFAFCLMPNHFHLLMEVKNISNSIVMQRLLTFYTKYYNKKYKKIGHLFQGRYKSILCEKDNYLLELVRYIHLNPFRAGLVNKPGDWQWSGHKEYLEGNSNLLDMREVLGVLSTNLKHAVTKYAEFVRDGSQMGKRKDYYPEEKMPYVGSDSFVDNLIIKHKNLVASNLLETRLDLKSSLKDILDKIVKENNIKADAILNGVRTSDITKSRVLFIMRAIDNGYKGKDIAGYINCSECYITKVKNNNK